MLIGFLKFTTGSSKLHYGKDSNNIKVVFVNRKTTLLPISHTCFKTMESPKYESLDVMKKKYDLSFTLGA